MKFRNEAELRSAIAAWLEAKGERPQQEAWVTHGRLDILTNRYAIEVKLSLSHRALFQAVGQLVVVAPSGLRLVAAGLTPSKNKERSIEIAEILREKGLQIWFLDQDEGFLNFIGQTSSPELENSEMIIWPILDRLAEHGEAEGETEQDLRICIEYLGDRLLADEDRIAALEAGLHSERRDQER